MLFLRAAARSVRLLCVLRLAVLLEPCNWVGERGSVRRRVVITEAFAWGLRTLEFTRTPLDGRTELGRGRSICGAIARSTDRVSRTLGVDRILDDRV